MLTKLVFISDRLPEFQKYFRSDHAFNVRLDMLTHTEANQRYIYRNFYEVFIVDLSVPWLSVPQWIREQAQQYYFHQFIFISDKPINPLITKLLGPRIFKTVSFKEAQTDLNSITEEVSRFFDDHQYQYDKSKFITETPFEGLVGEHPSVKRINDFIKLVSRARFAPCLISGANGTGKTLCAHLIHHVNDLHDDMFFVKDCEKATTNELLGDLFGVDDESGIYGPKRRGLLEIYSGGTIVLRNIEKLPPDVQDKLLLYLEDKIFRPLGSNRVIESSVRIIAMSEHKLERFVKRRDFNPDLFFHLNAFEISLPPLQERGEDILLLADYYLQFTAQLLAKPVQSISLPAQRLLKEYIWPGNIRQLKQVMEQAVLHCKSTEIGLDDLPDYLNGGQNSSHEDNHLGNCSLKEIERLHIERVLMNTNGNKSKAAALLQISRTTLREKLKQYAIP